MSEYQYYEFLTIDRPLSHADRTAIRALSTRARITTTSFTNSYEWGDFKSDPAMLMERWFDLHLYLANWGTRRLMIRLPKRLIDQRRLEGFLREADCFDLKVSGENLILDIVRDVEPEDDWDDGSDWLVALAPLRADILTGDLRLFYLLWLMAVEADAVGPDETEPAPESGPMTGALEAFAAFFRIDPDLVAAAGEQSIGVTPESADVVRQVIGELPDPEKSRFLIRLIDGDPHVANELRALVRERSTSGTAASPFVGRTVAELRARADAIRRARENAETEKAAADAKRQVEEAERRRRMRLDATARRGDDVWREIEDAIARRNPSGYDKAISLLLDLRTIAEQRGTTDDFTLRLRAIRERHARKERFIQRLKALR